ncbi:suppressor of cytokine signaling 5-like [Ornithodoros turicata]
MCCEDNFKKRFRLGMKKMVLCRKSSSGSRGLGRASANGDLVRNETDDEKDDCSHLSCFETPSKSEAKPSIFKALRCHFRRCKRKALLTGDDRKSSGHDCANLDASHTSEVAPETRTSTVLTPDQEHDNIQRRASVETSSPPCATSSSDANDNYVSGKVECHRPAPAVGASCSTRSHRANHNQPNAAVDLVNMPRNLTVDFRINSLTQELFKLSKFGWYWGPITRSEAEEKLADQPDGAFLVRDSSDDRYLLSLSFKSYGKTLHTRIEHCSGLFSFYAQSEPGGRASIVDLIEESMNYSQSGVFCYSRGRNPGVPSFPVRLIKPVSRLTHVRSLQYLCRFIIRQYTRFDHIQRLPLPSRIKGYIEEGHY